MANRLADVNGVPYTWDNNGNLLNDGVNTYTYDFANRLISFNGTSLYAYNGLGDRLQQTVNGNTTTYALDLNTGLTQVLNDGTNTYLYGVGRIAQAAGATTEYFLGDALGSVRQLTDASGEIILAKSYQPYGESLSSVGNGTSLFAFTGEQQDASGLTYLRARYYTPNDGRFLTRDAWMGDENEPMSYNLWNYSNSNPVNYIDPTGQLREGCNTIKDRIATAMKYVSAVDRYGNQIKDEINTYTAAGIAVQCYGGDNPFNNNSGQGIAQITFNQARTEYGLRIGPEMIIEVLVCCVGLRRT